MQVLIPVSITIILGCLIVGFSDKLSEINKTTKIVKESNNIARLMIYFIPVICLIIFLLGNYFKSGLLFSELFYKLKSDFSMDFHVFFSESVLLKESYIGSSESFNPPLIKVISLFLYRSFPQEYQSLYAESAINNPVQDIRLLIEAVLPFIFFVVLSLVFLSLLIYNQKKGTIIEKIYCVCLAIINVGVLFAIERGNYILLALPFCFVFVLMHQNENKIVKEIALISLGIAAGLKVYPCLLGVILIAEKEWKSAIKTIIYGAVFLFGPFLFYGGMSGIIGFISSLLGTGTAGLRIGTLNFTSFFCTIITLFGLDEAQYSYQLMVFKILTYILFFTSIVMVAFLKEYWKKIAILILLIIMYTGTAHTYMLSLLIIPIFLFLNSNKTKAFSNYFYALDFAILSSIIVIPPSEFILSIRGDIERVTVAMIIQQFVVVVLFILVYSEGILGMIHYICAQVKKKQNIGE